jgi:hypothetical protein
MTLNYATRSYGQIQHAAAAASEQSRADCEAICPARTMITRIDVKLSNALPVPTSPGLVLGGDVLLDPVATQTIKGTIVALLQSEQGDFFAITAGHVVDDVLSACVRVPQSDHTIELERRWPCPDEEELDIR